MSSESDASGIEENTKRLEQRLDQLEPPEPVSIKVPPWEADAAKFYPTNTVPITEVMSKGTRIPFTTIMKETDHVRPIYAENWHSTYWGGRWSYVPRRIHTAMHRLFPTYDIGLSAEMDFKENLGINFPTFQNKTDLDLYIVAFQTDIKDVYTLGNQIVIVGAPKRHGVEVITVKTRNIHPRESEKLLLVQLATLPGDELDYSHIVYVPPDFWAKQIQEAEQRKSRELP